jgi:UDP:flavonoid glycosyltransferase YjiC (YdhE family)
VSAEGVRAALETILQDPAYTRNAAQVSAEFARYRVGELFPRFVDRALWLASQRKWG